MLRVRAITPIAVPPDELVRRLGEYGRDLGDDAVVFDPARLALALLGAGHRAGLPPVRA
jgi:hypothetical protein